MFKTISPDLVRIACTSYLKGLQWTFDYYFNFSQPVDCEWYYAYDFAPCVTDIHKNALTQTPIENVNSIRVNPDIDPAHLQLLLVLPPQSKHLLPLHLQPIMTDINFGCVHYYPRTFQVHTYLKTKMWECSPIIPNINIQTVVNAYKSISSRRCFV
jgi:5'-3' exonuclease